MQGLIHRHFGSAALKKEDLRRECIIDIAAPDHIGPKEQMALIPALALAGGEGRAMVASRDSIVLTH